MVKQRHEIRLHPLHPPTPPTHPPAPERTANPRDSFIHTLLTGTTKFPHPMSTPTKFPPLRQKRLKPPRDMCGDAAR
jgi:hypothetical protein